MTSLWQRWKEKNGQRQATGIVKPYDVLNPDTPYIPESQSAQRLSVCESCPRYMATKQCSLCFCFMPLKVTMLNAKCPEERWS